MSDFHDRELVDRSGDSIGMIVDTIADPIDLQPEWLVVKLGHFGGEHLVPVAAVERRDDHFVVGASRDDVKATPRTRHHTPPTPPERDELYRHYGMAAS